jgi:hypothetical protein
MSQDTMLVHHTRTAEQMLLHRRWARCKRAAERDGEFGRALTEKSLDTLAERQERGEELSREARVRVQGRGKRDGARGGASVQGTQKRRLCAGWLICR